MADDLDLSELERLAAEATAALAAYYADPSIAASSRVSRTKAAASRAAGRALPALLRRIRASERREAEMREAASAMLVAVKYTHAKTPPKAFGDINGEPNLCYEARIPVQFVTDLEVALDARKEA